MRSTVENILRWFAGIGATFKGATAYFSRSTRRAPDIAETHAVVAAREVEVVAAVTESAVAPPTAAATLTAATPETKSGPDAQVSGVAPIIPEQQEIRRRRELVRKLFNDFWSGFDDKPTAFADRLDEAETYLNERLTASGEFWQLDADTRKMLGLPPRSKSRKDHNGAARR
jgi:hypothetical protein